MMETGYYTLRDKRDGELTVAFVDADGDFEIIGYTGYREDTVKLNFDIIAGPYSAPLG
jgi:hypothetical protein